MYDVTDTETFDLFECMVCTNCLTEREPRVLHCGHTFCTPCLQKMLTWPLSFISCPKCRRKTHASSGVKGLAKNTDIIKMKEREIQLRKKQDEGTSGCQMCKQDLRPEYFCTECKQLICRNCAQKHKTISVLRSHKVLPLKNMKEQNQSESCEYHNQPLIYFCEQCKEILCVMCICEYKHSNHNERLISVDTAMKQMKTSFDRFTDSVTSMHQKLASGLNVVTRELSNVKDMKHKLKVKLESEIKDAEETENTLQRLSVELADQLGATTDLERRIELFGGGTQSTDQLNCYIKAERLLECMSQVLEKFYSLKFSDENFSWNDSSFAFQSRHSRNKFLDLELLLTVKLNDFVTDRKFIQLEDMTCLKDGTILLIFGWIEWSSACRSNHVKHALIIDNSGKFKRGWNISRTSVENENSYIRSVKVFEEKLFFVLYSFKPYNDWIKIENLDDSACGRSISVTDIHLKEKVYIKKVAAAFQTNIILILTFKEDRKSGETICQYHLETQKLEKKISNMIEVERICVACFGKDLKYIVPCKGYIGVRLSSQVHIYSRNWRLLTTILGPEGSDLCSPVVTPCGNLLILEVSKRNFLTRKYSSVIQYDLAGQKIRQVLQASDIDAIAYSGTYLWTLECDNVWQKMKSKFRVYDIFHGNLQMPYFNYFQQYSLNQCLVDNHVISHGFKPISGGNLKLKSFFYNYTKPLLALFIVCFQSFFMWIWVNLLMS